MSLLVSLLLVVNGQQPTSFYFKLSSALDYYLNTYQHDITYSAIESNKVCPDEYKIGIAFHPQQSVRDNHCFLKCESNPTDPSCGSYAAICDEKADIRTKPFCFTAGNYLCFESLETGKEQMEGLCNSVDGCDSYSIHLYLSGKTDVMYIGTLSQPGCRDIAEKSLPSLSGVNSKAGSGGLYYKDALMTQEKCPLGLGVEVSGGPYPMMEGLYEADVSGAMELVHNPGRTDARAPKYYRHVDEGNVNYISWHQSGCGWAGVMLNMTELPAPVVLPACVDDDHLANYLFGQCSDPDTCSPDTDLDYEANFCQLVQTVWGGTYCHNTLFAHVCPAACGMNCLVDDDDTALLLLQMNGITAKAPKKATDPSYCQQVLDELGCEYAFTSLVCPVTAPCTDRRLQPLAQAHRRELLGFLKTDRKMRRLGWEFDTGPAELPAGIVGKFEEVFYTFDGSNTAKGACTPGPLDYMLNVDTVFDVRTFHEPLEDYSLVHSCESTETYIITDETVGQYCQHNNVQVTYNEDPEIVQNACVRKCSDLGFYNGVDLSLVDTITDGENNWCSGNDADFVSETNALCLPREECERLCSKPGSGCESIDMHTYLPRCYLNTPACGVYDVGSSTFTPASVYIPGDYDILVKMQTPDETLRPDMAGDSERITYTTATGLNCSGVSETSTKYTGYGRMMCEEACSSDASCLAFWIEYKASTFFCELFSEPVMCPPVTEQVNETDIQSTDALVTKVMPDPCALGVTLDGITDEYYRLEETTYMQSLNLTRVVYTDTKTGECDGWRVQTNEAPMVELEFTNCSDHIDAARAWLPVFLESKEEDKWLAAYKARQPDTPCEDITKEHDLQHYLGIGVTEYRSIENDYKDLDTYALPDDLFYNTHKRNRVCEILYYNFTNYYIDSAFGRVNGTINISEDLTQIYEFIYKYNKTGTNTTYTYYDVLRNGTTVTLNYSNTSDVGYMYLFNNRSLVPILDGKLILPGTSLCDICCATIIRLGGKCATNLHRGVNQTYANSSTNAEWKAWPLEVMPSFPQGSYEFPCQWGSDEGLCGNPVFTGLCPHTCHTMTTAVLGSSTLAGQDVRLYGDNGENFVTSMNSTCEESYDNNYAMYRYRLSNLTWPNQNVHGHYHQYVLNMDPRKACMESVMENPYVCFGTDGTYVMPVVRALCPSACALAPEDTTTPPPPPPDESSPEGASERRLYTTSYSGTYTTFYTASYVPYDGGMWENLAYTWMNGSSFDTSPANGAYWLANGDLVKGSRDSVCPNLDSGLDKYPVLTTDTLYRAHMPTMDTLITTVCRGVSVCPELSTCVLNPHRMEDEMLLFRAAVTRSAPLSSLLRVERAPVLASENFIPKVLLSLNRAEAIVEQSKAGFAHSIYRTVPLATRVSIEDDSLVGDRLIISLAEDTVEEFGRFYGGDAAPPLVKAGHLRPCANTDTIRIERFNADTSDAGPGTFVFKLIAPGCTSDYIAVYRYAVVPTVAPIDVTEEGGSVVYLPSENAWVVTVSAVNSDFIILEDVNDCEMQCQKGSAEAYTVDALCTNRIAAPAECSCPEGYSGNGYVDGMELPPFTEGTPCTIMSLTYKAEGRAPAGHPPEQEEKQDYYLRMRHLDRLDYGWRIDEINFYSDKECTKSMTWKDMKTEVDSPLGEIYTGPAGNAEYPSNPPGLYTGINLVDKKTTGWRSACLNCNPEVVDNTHHGAVEIIVSVRGDVAVQCIGFDQQGEGRHNSKSITIERGPVSGEGCDMSSVGSLCKPTMVWAKSNLPASPSSKVVEEHIVMTCGMPNTMYYGELLVVPGTEASGHYGSVGTAAEYSSKNCGGSCYVPSACHCQELCMLNIANGCRSYVYDDTLYGGTKNPGGHCFLQTNTFRAVSGPIGTFPGKTSGTPSLRAGTYPKPGTLSITDAAYLQRLSFSPPTGPVDGQPFSLTIEGVGFPYDDDKAKDKSDFQRMKIVQSHQGCHEPVPKEVQGIGCAKSRRVIPTIGGGKREQTVYTICSPPPTGAVSAEGITWTGLTISATAETSTYSVCYCAVNCFSPSAWEKVPGTFGLTPATFSWTSTGTYRGEPEIYRKVVGEDLGRMSITVTRPEFSSFSDPSLWELKVIREHFDCSVEQDEDEVKCVDDMSSLRSLTDPGVACDGTGIVGGPDEASWGFLLSITADEVGSFQICFRESSDDGFKTIPAATGEKFVEVLRLPADTTHPRGVFHNQYFSASAGAGFVGEFTVAGTRLPVPTDGKVLLTTGECGSPGTFGFLGTVGGAPVEDTTPPFLKDGRTATAGGTDGGHLPQDATFGSVPSVELLRLAFTEPITVEGCFGNFSLVDSGGNKVVYPCTDAVTFGNFVYISTDPLADSTYTIEIQTGAVLDMAGNYITEMTTATGAIQYSFTTDSTATNDPTVLLSVPDPGGAMSDSTFFIFFDVKVSAANTFLQLYDCGPDFACDNGDFDRFADAFGETGYTLPGNSDDVLMYRWAAEEVHPVANATVQIDMSNLGSTYGAWKLVVPAGAFTTAAGGASKLLVIEFVNDKTGFDISYTMKASGVKSASDALVFDVNLDAAVPPGTYNLCYCDDQADVTLQDKGDNETTYKLHDDVYLTKNLADPDGDIAGMAVEDHNCHEKCKMGCVGPSCYCEGYTGDMMFEATLFCLPPSLCKEACHNDANCEGISVHDTLPQCLFARIEIADLRRLTEQQPRRLQNATNATANVTIVPLMVVDEVWQFFEKTGGTACTQVHDFLQPVGSFAVTSRVDVAVDYVATPGATVSIEVTGRNLTYESSNFLQSLDRITVIDGLGTCGLSSPSSSVELEGIAGITTIADWAGLPAWSYYQEPANEDPGNIPHPDQVVVPAVVRPPVEYVSQDPGTYCPERNMDLDKLEIPLRGVMVKVKEHQCYTKCSQECLGDDCFCDGYYSGYDDESSNAICGNEELCQYICTNARGIGMEMECVSIDQHATYNRCFLNSIACGDQMATLSDLSYTLMIKKTDVNQEATRRLAHMGDEYHVPVHYSWDAMLRFKGLRFTSGGTFKVCFCDSSLLPEGAVCSSEQDFSIQVGLVHSSGVSCLLEYEALQRVSCVSQLYGGLRCYANYPVPTPELPVVDSVSFLPLSTDDMTPGELSTYCLTRPEEVVCQT
jgi:hypothetical protein